MYFCQRKVICDMRRPRRRGKTNSKTLFLVLRRLVCYQILQNYDHQNWSFKNLKCRYILPYQEIRWWYKNIKLFCLLIWIITYVPIPIKVLFDNYRREQPLHFWGIVRFGTFEFRHGFILKKHIKGWREVGKNI